MNSENYKYNASRINLLKKLIEDELKNKGFNVTVTEAEANYKMKVLLIQDGIISKTTISFLYSLKRKTGIVGLDIRFLNTKTNELVLAYRTKNNSFIEKTNMLYFIPVNTSSSNFDMKY